MSNLVPRRYRGVAVTEADVPLRPVDLRDHFLGREAYRRTEYIVVRHDGIRGGPARGEGVEGTAVLADHRRRGARGPRRDGQVHAPSVDTGVPDPARAGRPRRGPRRPLRRRPRPLRARELHPRPRPVPLRIVEVVPPEPAKLVDQVDGSSTWPRTSRPSTCEPRPSTFATSRRARPSDRYLFPCRGSGAESPGATVDYLDTRPPRGDWVLVGCARSREIHEHFYGDEPPHVEMCPRELVGSVAGPTLTKCCLLEDRIERDGRSSWCRGARAWRRSARAWPRRSGGGAGVGARLTDSALYGHLWATDELRAIFDEHARLRSWLEILVDARRSAGRALHRAGRGGRVDPRRGRPPSAGLEYVAAETVATGHSTLGLIRGLQRILPPDARASGSTTAARCRT